MFDETAGHSDELSENHELGGKPKDKIEGYPPPSDEEVQKHSDFKAQIPIRLKLEEIADVDPQLNRLFENKALLDKAAQALTAMQTEIRQFVPNYSIADKPTEELISRLKTELSETQESHEIDSGQLDSQLIEAIHLRLLSEHPNKGILFGKDMVTVFSDEAALQAAIAPHLAEMGIVVPEGQTYVFTKDMSELVSQIQENIAALDTMSAASPDYAAKIEQAKVDVTDRAAVQSFVIESGFMEDETVSETAKAEVAKQLGIVREVETTTGSDVDNTLDSQNPDGSPFMVRTILFRLAQAQWHMCAPTGHE